MPSALELVVFVAAAIGACWTTVVVVVLPSPATATTSAPPAPPIAAAASATGAALRRFMAPVCPSGFGEPEPNFKVVKGVSVPLPDARREACAVDYSATHTSFPPRGAYCVHNTQ